jgi:hypothetical protein
MNSRVKFSRARHAVWIDVDQALWREAARKGTRLHFIDGQDLTVDEKPGDVKRLLRRGRESRRQARRSPRQ